MDIILKYFADITNSQREQFEALGALYREWNSKINVISRKDIDNLYVNHILHSLAIAKFVGFNDGAKIIDIGTGGGLPGIPLAIFFPNVEFLLVDRIRKKVSVAENIAFEIGLANVECRQADIAEIRQTADFVVSRAVMELPKLVSAIRKNVAKESHHSIPNGLICLKGGNLDEETKLVKRKVILQNISDYFEEPFFETKKIVYVSL